MSNYQLQPKLGLGNITFYGIGTIIGAGVYVLVGKVAGPAGLYLPWAFLIAGIIALFTALSYAELASRFPKSAGTALYVYKATNIAVLTRIIGYLVALTGLVSAAAIINGFVGYFQLFVESPRAVAIIGVTLLLTAIACWGIKASAWTVTLITCIEVGGLLYVIFVISGNDPVIEYQQLLPPFELDAWAGILMGSFLAFYAFVGFEDMVNVAEEIKNPRRNLPLAIFIAIAAATIIYLLVAFFAVRYLSVDRLVASDAPLAELVANAGHSTTFIGVIALFAVINGALVQLIMASRLFYGMANQKLAPKVFQEIHHNTKTPIKGTLILAVVLLAVALWLPLTTLAKLTSFLMLIIFSAVNISLILIKRKQNTPAEDVISVPWLVPVFGLVLTLLFIVIQLMHWSGLTGGH